MLVSRGVDSFLLATSLATSANPKLVWTCPSSHKRAAAETGPTLPMLPLLCVLGQHPCLLP